MPLIFFSIAKGKLPTYILPCFAPLALLLADHLDQIRQSGKLRALKANGIINIVFGVLMAVAVLVISGILPVHVKAVFGRAELPRALIGILCFAVWALAGAMSLTDLKKRWYWAAICPLVLALLIGQAIPQKVIDSKQPQAFLDQNSALLHQSRYILADNVGVATGLAWMLKRSDIIMFDERGELEYGLSYPDAQDKFVDAAGFPAWLQKARQEGNISVVIKLDSNIVSADKLPPADHTVQVNRLALLFYKKLP